MQYEFDKIIDRHNTGSIKWDGAYTSFGDKAQGALPMWIADMDFAVAPEITAALKKRVEHAIFGYPLAPQSYYDAVIGWMQRHFDWTVKREWIHFSPGIDAALNYIVQAFTKTGDAILIQSPVYYPYTDCIVDNHRKVVLNPMKLENGMFNIDFADFEQKIVDNHVKLYLLCNPHNPGGRVWTRDELAKLLTICKKYQVMIISDEIHADLVYSGYKNTAFGTVAEGVYDNYLVCTSASKTFNLAGLMNANIIIPNPELGKVFFTYMNQLYLLRPNIFGQVATEAAYTYGDEWLKQLRAYLEGNLNFLINYMEKHIPEIKVMRPQATYLVFLDCNGLGLNNEELREFMLTKAGVVMDDGFVFGPGGEGFKRMNIACPRATLAEACERIEKAVKNR
jgi:cystathionine beta-lyase